MDSAERLTELISKYLEVGDSDFYICTRDKSAFAAGTMTLNDFTEVDDEIASDMAEWLTKRGVILPPCKPGDKVYFVIDDNISGMKKKPKELQKIGGGKKKMREKLIELLIKYGVTWYTDKLADYLLQNGVVLLPCELGDTVWYITNNKCKDVKIENIHQWVSGHWKFDGFHGVGQYREGYEFDLNDFGKTVFLTKEEAEKALKRSKAK